MVKRLFFGKKVWWCWNYCLLLPSEIINDRKLMPEASVKDYWIPAANNLKTYGAWDLLEVRDIDQLEDAIKQWLKEQ